MARKLIHLTLAGGLILSLCIALGRSEAVTSQDEETRGAWTSHTTEINRPDIVGHYYDTTVPDTLDLAERGRLGISHFTESIREELNYEMVMGVNFPGNGAANVVMHITGLACCQAKCAEAMAMLRMASGSTQHLEREAKMLDMLAANIGEEGIWWVPQTTGRPWLGPDGYLPYANTHGQGRMLRAMVMWYQYSKSEKWKQWMDRMVDGMDRVFVVHKDDYAYVPILGWMPEEYFRSSYVAGRGWKDTSEPVNEKGGEEGSLFNHQANIAGPLATWYALTGNEQALRLSGEMVRFLMKPQFWADAPNGDYPGVVGAEHAHWQGHLHGYANALRSILDYAVVTNDAHLKQFVRDGYEWARAAQNAIPTIGKVGDGQGCGIGRMLGLAVKLSYDGVGDYWEDVDQYIRNHAVAYQITAPDVLRMIGKGHLTADEYDSPVDVMDKLGDDLPTAEGLPGITAADVIGSAIGEIPGNAAKSGSWQCCGSHGNMSFYYAWDGALRHSEGAVQVNLLINRASPWMDVDSYLPYEGKVVLKNKKAKEAFVRIPLWVDKDSVKCQIGDKQLSPKWFGRYLYFDDLKPNSKVIVRFPMVERTEKWTLGKTVHSLQFRGNTLITISPSMSQLYDQRAEKYKTAQAPIRKVKRYVTEQVLDW